MAAHNEETSCVKDARRFFSPLVKRRQSYLTPGVKRIRIDGRRAFATVVLSMDRLTIAPFVLERGRWKLASVAGVGVKETPVENLPVAGAPEGDPVFVQGRRGGTVEACPDLVRSRDGTPPALSGGCVLDGSSPDIELTLVTVFGRFVFANCRSEIEMRVDGEGRAFVSRFRFRGERACGDVLPCSTRVRGPEPGEGQLYAFEDDFYSRISLCLDNCVGRFVGDLRLRLEHNPETGWYLQGVSSIAQNSGFGVKGVWNLGHDGVNVRRKAAAGA